MQPRRALLYIVTPWALVACDPSVRANDRDAIEATEIVEQDPDWPGFLPLYFGVTSATFGYDALTERAIPVTSGGDTGDPQILPITVRVVLLDAEAASSGEWNEENHCEVVMTRNEPLAMSGWGTGSGAWFAFELRDSIGSTTCGALDFDPEVWGDDAVHTHVTKWTWGAGLNPLSADAMATLGDDFGALSPWLQGGGFYWEELPVFVDASSSEGEPYDADGYVDSGITFAYRLDDAHQLVLDGGEPVLLPADTLVSPEGDLSTAYYEVQPSRLLSPAQHLTLEP